MPVIPLILIGALVGYVATVYSDFLIHRNVWHGRWRIVHSGPLRWLLYPHYVHHLKAHHRHARHHRHRLEMGAGVPEEPRRKMEARYRAWWNVRYGLQCTEDGITIHGIECLIHYWAVYFVTPQPYVALAVWHTLGPVAGFMAAVMPGCAMITQIIHRYYHMSAAARVEHAPRWLRWAVRSKEFGRLAEEHQKHHYDPLYRDDYYGVLPFGNWLLRPLLGKN